MTDMTDMTEAELLDIIERKLASMTGTTGMPDRSNGSGRAFELTPESGHAGAPRVYTDDSTVSERQPFKAVQDIADRAALALGDSAPGPLLGETLPRYRLRLLSRFRQHCPKWQNVELAKLDDSVLSIAEAAIYQDAERAARDATTVPAGTLRELKTRDAVGRVITQFLGDPEVCWSRFKGPVQVVTKFNAVHPGKRPS